MSTDVHVLRSPTRAPDPRRGRPGFAAIAALEHATGAAAIYGEPVGPYQLDALELELGIGLPLDYRAFVAAWGHVAIDTTVVYGLARDASHPRDVRGARAVLLEQIHAAAVWDPQDRAPFEHRAAIVPIADIAGVRYILDTDGALCTYDLATDRIAYVGATFLDLLAGERLAV